MMKIIDQMSSIIDSMILVHVLSFMMQKMSCEALIYNITMIVDITSYHVTSHHIIL